MKVEGKNRAANQLDAPTIVPITGKAARKLIAEWHRHLPNVQGALFAVAVKYNGEVVGVGTAGNPARVWQGTGRFCITRVAVRSGWARDGHAAPFCSMIYGALCRAGKALGYSEAWTYTLPHEPGTSLRAAGFIEMGLTDGGEWDRPSRRRNTAICSERKRRWMRPLAQIRAANQFVARGGEPEISVSRPVTLGQEPCRQRPIRAFTSHAHDGSVATA